MVAELGKLTGDAVLTPERVFLPHPPDQGSGVRIHGWATDRTTRATTLEELLEGTVPSQKRLWADDSDSSEERGKRLGHARDGEPITGLESRVWGGPLEDDDLLAKQGILAEESSARAEQADEGSGQAGHAFMGHQGGVSAAVGLEASDRPVVTSEVPAFALTERVLAAER
jgi:hypothetical protein